MKKYDYILVGSGLYSGVINYLARQEGKNALLLKSVIILEAMCIVRILRNPCTQIWCAYFPYQQ